jgi:hypothetical protein
VGSAPFVNVAPSVSSEPFGQTVPVEKHQFAQELQEVLSGPAEGRCPAPRRDNPLPPEQVRAAVSGRSRVRAAVFGRSQASRMHRATTRIRIHEWNDKPNGDDEVAISTAT